MPATLATFRQRLPDRQDGVDAGWRAVDRQPALGGPWKFAPRHVESETVKWQLFRSMWGTPSDLNVLVYVGL